MNIVQKLIPCVIVVLSVGTIARCENIANHFVFERGQALFSQVTPDGPAEKLCDNAHYEKATRNGSHFYVLLRYDSRSTWLTVLQCDANGLLQRVRTVADDKLQPVTAIMSASFLPDGRLLVDTHVSPRESITVTLDMGTGKYFVEPSGE